MCALILSSALVSATVIHDGAVRVQAYRCQSSDALASYPVLAQVLVVEIAAATVSATTASSLAAAVKARCVPCNALRTAYNAACRRHGLKPPEALEFVELLERLKADGLVNMPPAKDPTKRVVELCVDLPAVEAELGNKPFWRK